MKKNLPAILIVISLNLCINLGRNDILTVWSFSSGAWTVCFRSSLIFPAIFHGFQYCKPSVSISIWILGDAIEETLGVVGMQCSVLFCGLLAKFSHHAAQLPLKAMLPFNKSQIFTFSFIVSTLNFPSLFFFFWWWY
jgi:hypothetical protein